MADGGVGAPGEVGPGARQDASGSGGGATEMTFVTGPRIQSSRSGTTTTRPKFQRE